MEIRTVTNRKLAFLWLGFWAIFGGAVSAQQPVVIPNTVQHELQSSITNQKYILDIALPYKYSDSNDRYPVVYLLDANNDFPLVTSIARRLQAEDELKDFFIVGISYPSDHWIHRRRDYTPTHALPVKNSGGGPNFAKILASEIIPFVDKAFHTQENSRTLLGHSLGGLFGAFLAVNDSDLFDSYIISSPSLWWDDTAILKGQKGKRRQQRMSLFITVGAKENPHMIEAWKDLHTFAEQEMKPSVQKAVSLEGENHASAKFRAYADGLRWLFAHDVVNKRLTNTRR